MRYDQPSIWAVALFASCAALTIPAGAATVTINPFKDNTLFQSSGGELSSGAGTALYSGRTGPNDGDLRRRAVMAFDVASSVPAGSTITGASLQMQVTKTSPLAPSEVYALRVLTADWGEVSPGGSVSTGGSGGTPVTNDATWIHRFFNTAQVWINQGGDFSPTISASKTLTGFGAYTWSSPQMAADVQVWLDTPSNNFGWILIGNETSVQDAKQFGSRENSSANRPALTITYIVPEPGAQSLLGVVGIGGLIRRSRSAKEISRKKLHGVM